MTELRPYPVYRDSGVEWLGEVPEHWSLRRNRWLFGERNETEFSSLPILEVSLHEGVCLREMGAGGRKQQMKERNRYKRAKKDDIAYNTMRMWQGAVGIVPADGLVSPAYVVVTPIDSVASSYYGYLFRTNAHKRVVKSFSRGIVPDRDRLYWDEFKRIVSIVPPLPEQIAIARFLDYSGRRNRRYIRAQQGLIDLLEEQKWAIIRQAVTGQVDVRTGRPYPAYKDSGAEWLGSVPKHWGVVGLCYRYEQCLGKMLDGKRITGEHLLPYLRNVDVQWDDINVADLPHMDIHPDEMARYTVRPGDLLVCEGGEVGRCAIWKGEISRCGFQKALHRLRPRNDQRDRPRFLYYAFLLAVTRSAFTDGHESTIAHLTGEKLRRHRFAFPCVDEQIAIVRFLDNVTATIGRTIELTHRQIALLREYRTRLIADVVTGKLDVREAAGNLPEADPITDGNQVDTIQTASHPHAIEHDMAKEAGS